MFALRPFTSVPRLSLYTAPCVPSLQLVTMLLTRGAIQQGVQFSIRPFVSVNGQARCKLTPSHGKQTQSTRQANMFVAGRAHVHRHSIRVACKAETAAEATTYVPRSGKQLAGRLQQPNHSRKGDSMLRAQASSHPDPLCSCQPALRERLYGYLSC